MDIGQRGLKAGLIAVGGLAAGLAAGAVLWAGGDSVENEPAATVAPAGDLYVVDGRLAAARTSEPGTLEVALEDASVLWFSDRPARLRGNRPIGRFVAQWPSTFGADQPNAAALALSDDASERAAVVELQRPTFDSSTGVTTFVLRPEGGSNAPEARRLSKALDRARSQRGRLVLFVDSGAPSPPTPPSPSPAVEVETAFAQGEAAIDVLQTLAASGGTAGALAEADLKALQQAAAVGR